MGFFGQEINSLPLWLYLLCGVLAVIVGKGIRIWLDRRKQRQAALLAERRKEVKAQRKRMRKQLKKAGKGGKGNNNAPPEVN